MISKTKPLVFKSKSQFREFIYDIAKVVLTKFNNFTILCIGSATTFYSINPHKKKLNTFFSPSSDLDINIIVNENFNHHKQLLDKLNYHDNHNERNNTDLHKIIYAIYPNYVTRQFFDENIMHSFFQKWGPQNIITQHNIPEFTHVDINNTILKRNISLVITIKPDIYDFPDIIYNNKTCFPIYATFIKNGDTLSYWDENNKYVTQNISK
jgi:hypothetical protein